MSILYNLDYHSGQQSLTQVKSAVNTAIYEGQFVVKSVIGGGYEKANSTTPAGTRAWIVTRDSLPGCPHVSIALSGIVRVLFATPAALTSYNTNLTTYTQTGYKLATLGADGVVGVAGAVNVTAVGQVRMNNGSRTLDVIKNYGTGFVSSSKEASVERCTEPAILATSPAAIYSYALVR